MFIEEPVLSEHAEALKEIANHCSTPIALGERLYSRWDFKRILADGYVDIVQPDPVPCGRHHRDQEDRRDGRGLRRRARAALPAGPDRARRQPAARRGLLQRVHPGAVARHPLQHDERPARLPEGPVGVRVPRRASSPSRRGRAGHRDRRGGRGADAARRAIAGATRSGGTPTAASPSGSRSERTSRSAARVRRGRGSRSWCCCSSASRSTTSTAATSRSRRRLMRETLGLDTAQMGYVLSAFGWTYALLQIPGGWLVDRVAPRVLFAGADRRVVDRDDPARLHGERGRPDGDAHARRRAGGAVVPDQQPRRDDVVPRARARHGDRLLHVGTVRRHRVPHPGARVDPGALRLADGVRRHRCDRSRVGARLVRRLPAAARVSRNERRRDRA